MLLMLGQEVTQECKAQHWAFQPINKYKPPTVTNKAWPQNPIDCFILAKLEAHGLQAAPRATNEVLHRRTWLALSGLPPSHNSELHVPHLELVDRLLASPRYGEHWARHWLDIARYADNKGHVFFEEKNFPWAWTYRDYVIRSLNQDKPFDRFIMEQLAADQFELGGDKTPLTALGFLTLGPRFSGNIHDILDDRIDVTTRGLMALTVSCARCHDHKYDPIPTADYYSLYGVFQSSLEPTLPPVFLPAPATRERRAFDAEMQKRLKAVEDFVFKSRQGIIISARTRVAEYLAAVHAKRRQPSTGNFQLLTDKDAINPYVIHRWEIYLEKARQERDPVWTVWHRFSELTDDEFGARAAEMHRELFKNDSNSINSLVHTAFESSPPKSMKEIVNGYGKLFRFITTQWEKQQDKTAGMLDSQAEALRQVLYGKNSPPMIPQRFGWGFLALLPDRSSQGDYKTLIKAVEQWSMTGKSAPPRAMILTDANPPCEPVIFKRGNPHQHGEFVPRQFLKVLSGKKRKPFQKGSGRLEMARAIASRDNPLTARVIVNRVWQWHFGQGLVTTPSDFGLRSQPPSHPNLLDWLANDFIRHGWSLKHLHRRITTSATWQMASTHPGEKQTSKTKNPQFIDPENQFYWKFSRRRLGFETLRDAVVAATGQLNNKTGGPSVNLLSGFNPRRSIYGFINRMDVSPVLRAFDFPDPNITCARREITTVSPQALYLMNNSFIVECAGRIAQREDLPHEQTEKILWLYQILLSRHPQIEEMDLARKYLGNNPDTAQWKDFVHALILTNEFSFID